MKIPNLMDVFTMLLLVSEVITARILILLNTMFNVTFNGTNGVKLILLVNNGCFHGDKITQ